MKIFARLATTVALVAATAASFAQAQPRELKVSLFTPPGTIVNRVFVDIAKELEQKSNGQLKLSLFHSSQLGPPPRQFDLARTGVADIAYVMTTLTPGRFPLTDLMVMPGIDATGSRGGAVLAELYDEYLAKEYAGTKVLTFLPMYKVPVFMKGEIKGLESLKGRRVRHASPVIATMLDHLGAVPTAIQSAEVGDALARGQIDGIVAGNSGVSSFKWHEHVRHMTDTGVGGLSFAIVMNTASYEKLSPEQRKVFDQVLLSDRGRFARAVDESEATERTRLMKEGVTEYRLTAADKAQFDKAAQLTREEVLADLEKKGLPARAYFKKLEAALTRNPK